MLQIREPFCVSISGWQGRRRSPVSRGHFLWEQVRGYSTNTRPHNTHTHTGLRVHGLQSERGPRNLASVIVSVEAH
jgi:hypothetical protein